MTANFRNVAFFFFFFFFTKHDVSSIMFFHSFHSLFTKMTVGGDIALVKARRCFRLNLLTRFIPHLLWIPLVTENQTSYAGLAPFANYHILWRPCVKQQLVLLLRSEHPIGGTTVPLIYGVHTHTCTVMMRVINMFSHCDFVLFYTVPLV